MVKSIFHKESELFIVKTPVPVAQSGTKVTSGLGGGSSTQSKGSEPIMVPSIIRSGYVRSVTLYLPCRANDLIHGKVRGS